jgi:pyrimidine-nucleoside phosphorylase
LVGALYELTERGSFEEGKRNAEMVIREGGARDRFVSWIEYLGGDPQREVKAKKLLVESPLSGYVQSIDGESLGWLVVEMGGGRKRAEDSIDYSVGLAFFKKIGDKVEKGEPIGEIYYNRGNVEEFKRKFLSSYRIGNEKVDKPRIVKKFVQ